MVKATSQNEGVWDFTHLCYVVTLRATLPFILRYVSHNLCLILHYVMHMYRTLMTGIAQLVSYTLYHYVAQPNLCYVTIYDIAQHNLCHA